MRVSTRLFAVLAMLAGTIAVTAAPPAARRNDGVETLNGQPASDHLRTLQERRAALFARASAAMKKRGFEPTDIVTVVRAERQAARREGAPGDAIQLVQETFSNADGEITIWSYDDGDDSTWEGILYFEDYATGRYAMHEAQIDVSTSVYAVAWESEIGSGGPNQPYDHYPVSGGAPKARVAAVLASASLDSFSRSDIQLVQLDHRRVNDFMGCFGPLCQEVVSTCRWAGPFTMRCAIIGCTAAAIYCALTTL